MLASVILLFLTGSIVTALNESPYASFQFAKATSDQPQTQIRTDHFFNSRLPVFDQSRWMLR